MKRVVVLGISGRQSAIVWKLSQSENIEKIYFLPGNNIDTPKVECVDIQYNEREKLVNFIRDNNIEYVIPDGGEMYSSGIVDYFSEQGIKIFGPTKLASKLESSKIYSKEFMKKYGIPTVDYLSFTNFEEARKYTDSSINFPIVIKADGLVRGRGVTVVHTKDDAARVLEELFVKEAFGEAGLKVVIEEYIEGPEVSLHVISDGKSYKILPLSQDHKPLYDGNKGPNTGGMGTYAPLDWVSEDMLTRIEHEIIKPTFAGLDKENIVFKGLLFPGLMITKNGPMVLEYNTRFGAPETQSLMMLLDSDIDLLFEAVFAENLHGCNLDWKPGYATTVEVVSSNYPRELSGTDSVITLKNVDFNGHCFLTGVKKVGDKLVTDGGKNASISAYGDTLEEAINQAYLGVQSIEFEGMYYRKDIGRLNNILV